MTQSGAVLDALRHDPRPGLFVTLTCAGEVSARRGQQGLNNFWRRLKRWGYPVGEYVVAREFQGRGVVHYHVLILTSAFIANDEVIARAWGLGFTKTMRVDAGRATWYVSKYLGKGEGATLHSSVAVRVRYDAAAVSGWWHRLGRACWRYGLRMQRACRLLGDDSAALGVISRAVWTQVWSGGSARAVVGVLT